MRKKLALIVNPVSGRGQVKYSLFDVLSVFCSTEYEVSVFMTAAGGDAERFASEHGGEYDILSCIGGDGTLSEVFGGLMSVDREKRPEIGYIPMGTANDMASTLGLSHNPRTAAERIVNGKSLELDVGRLGDMHFSYIAAFGAFTDVSYTTPQESKKALGHLAYVLEGMSRLPLITSYHSVVEYDDGEVEGDFVFGGVTNSTSVAGLVKLDPIDVALSDGYFEVILIRNPQNLIDLNRIISNVMRQEYDPKYVVFLHTKKISFKFDELVAWTRDGENGGTYKQIEAENLHNAVTMIV